MDGQQFDRLTRRLATETSRRTLLKGLLGGAIGGSVALAGRSAAAQATCGPSSEELTVHALLTALAQILRALGIPVPLPPPLPEPPDCSGLEVLNPETCECTCPLTETDCPGGVDQAACACIEPVGCGTSGPCPSPCECRTSLNGTFCYSVRDVFQDCRSDGDCPVAGTSCQDIDALGNGSCQEIDCRSDPEVCPAGSQCTGGITCEELCMAV